ncbi:MAG: HAD-IA family hydrolase [Pseudomonadota bacterium]
MGFSLVIFDCDGVMFDSRRANEEFYNHIRAGFGLGPLTKAETDYVHMATAEESVNFIMPPQLRAQAQEYRLTRDYTPFLRFMTIEPDLLDLLEFIRTSKNIRSAVNTNRSNTIAPLLSHFGLDRYFDLVVSSLDVRRPKPDPESLLLILDKLGAPAEQALFIGDSPTDAAAARSAGVPLAAYRNRGLDAAYHLDRLAEVRGLIA